MSSHYDHNNKLTNRMSISWIEVRIKCEMQRYMRSLKIEGEISLLKLDAMSEISDCLPTVGDRQARLIALSARSWQKRESGGSVGSAQTPDPPSAARKTKIRKYTMRHGFKFSQSNYHQPTKLTSEAPGMYCPSQNSFRILKNLMDWKYRSWC